MRPIVAAVAVVLSLAVSAPARAEVWLTMHDGIVSLIAKDATVRQILTEWARIGQTKIVNVERIPGGPMTIELNNVTEAHALEVLLRAMSGYIAAPRAVDAANLSRFDRIIVMPTLASARPAVASTPPPPVYQQQAPQFMQQPVQADDDDDADDELPAPNVAVPPQNRGPVFNTFPQQPQFVNPQFPNPQIGQQPVQAPNQPGSSVPTVPYGGVSVPGMVAPPPPPQPGQPMPIPPPRRPGG